MSSQIQITGETKVKSLTGVLVGTSGVVSSLNIDGSLGIPQLDVNGKIIVSQLPNSVMEYKGTWDASTNTPTLVNGTGNQGDVYLCSVAGTVNFGAGAIAFVVSDQVIYSGSIWQKASGSNGTVTSVAVTETGDSLNITGSPITTSGTINIGFNGTNLQYINGAGDLTTFPTLSGYVTSVTGTAPVVSSGGTTPAISMAAATTSVNGYLASADFTTFNNKQNAITLTTTGTSGASTLVGATLNIPNYGSALTGYVPYTGATQDVDLGAFKLNAQSLHAKGTGGLGHLGLKHQSASATASANEVSLFADSLGDLSWLNGNLYLSKFITSSNTAARSYTFPNANGTVALTSDISYPVTSVFGRTGAVVATSGDYTTTLVTEGTNLYYTDVRARASNSFVAGSGAYNSTTGVITIPTNNNQITNGAGYTTNVGTVTSVAASGGTGISITGSPITTSGTITITNTAPDQTVALTASTGISVTGTYPNFTITNTSPSSGGTVTSVAMTVPTGLSISGSPITSSGTLAVSLTAGYSIPTTASQTNWDTAYTNRITSLTVTGSSGAATLTSNTLNVPTYTLSGLGGQPLATNLTSLSGLTYVSTAFVKMTASGTFALDTTAYGTGSVTSVAALTLGTSGTDLSSTVATSTTTPVITLNVPTASATNRGALSSADWSTFNGKESALTFSSPLVRTTNTISIPAATTSVNGYLTSTDWTTFNNKQSTITNPVTGTGTTNYLPKFTGTSTIGNSLIQDDGSTIGLGIAPIAGAKAYVYGTLAVRSGYGLQWGTNGYNLIYGDQTTNELYFYTNNVQRLLIASTGAATFSSSIYLINATTRISGDGNGEFGLNYGTTTTSTYTFSLYNNTTRTVGFTPAGAATFSSSVTATLSLYLKEASTNAFRIYTDGINGSLFFRDEYYSQTRMTISNTGNVGIGTTTIGSTLQLNGNAAIGYSASTAAPTNGLVVAGNILVGTTTENSYSANTSIQMNGSSGSLLETRYNGTTALRLGSSSDHSYFFEARNVEQRFSTNSILRLIITNGGVVQITGLTSNGTVATQSSNGSLYVSSDANLKIEDGFVENGLEKVLALKPRYFYWKDKEAFSADRQLGFYAQEVNAVSEETANTPSEGCGWGIYDRGLVALLTAAIQEQQAIIESLNNRLTKIENK